MYIDIYLTCYL